MDLGKKIYGGRHGITFVAKGGVCWIGVDCKDQYEAAVLADDLKERYGKGGTFTVMPTTEYNKKVAP